MTDKRIAKLKRKLMEARFHLLTRCTEFAAPLVSMTFVAVDNVRRMSTNGVCIYFDAGWLEKLNDWSLQFALCHQLEHIVLGHLEREQYYRGDRFHFACNVVANSHLFQYGFAEEKLPGIGVIHHETFFPKVEGRDVTAKEALRMIPFDPTSLPEAQRKSYLLDSDEWWDKPEDRGECGVTVLSPKDETPDDLSLSEDVIARIERVTFKAKERRENKKAPRKLHENSDAEDFELDYIEDWHTPDMKELLCDLRGLKQLDEEGADGFGLRERVLRKSTTVTKNWRSLLNHFLMDETRDYSFTPPDKRMSDTGFFLPDYNESETPILRVLFLVDCSSSITDESLNQVIAEVCAAMEQFNGILQGHVAFFDTAVRSVFSLTNGKTLLEYKPYVGGGTDFQCVFDYLHTLSEEERPSEMVIMTDGKGDFPDYSETMDIPVLWLLTSSRVHIPWGQAAYLDV